MKEVRIAYTLKQGDNLLKVAQCFETTVEKILSDNEHIRRNKYMPGEVLSIVPGSIHSAGAVNQMNELTDKRYQLSNEMRKRWQEHIFWTRDAIVSILDDMDDTQEILNRLLQNPGHIAEIYRPYYSSEVVKGIDNLISQHLTIAASLITALKNNDELEFKKQNDELYKNADEIAIALSGINPNYDEMELGIILRQHLNLLKDIAFARHSDNYRQDIEFTDKSHEQILALADYLAKGIVDQFPNKFNS